jgi:hypothetical protein
MTGPQTGAPTDLTGGMPATEGAAPEHREEPTSGDPLATLADATRARFTAIADRLIPAAHGMPSAAAVVTGDRLRFVFTARPDLLEPFRTALRPELGEDPASRLTTLERDDPTSLAALQLVLVAGYYTDRRVRELIGYPGQVAIEVRSWEVPPYLEEGLIDALLARGPVWRDPATGTRAVLDGTPTTYAERYWSTERRPEGGHDGHDGA